MTMTQTKSQQAQEYAEKKIQETIPECYLHDDQIYNADDIKDAYKQAYLDDYTVCEQSMWRSVDDEMPEDDRLVLAHFADVEPELSYATVYYSDGAWHIPDDWYYDCKIDFWIPIPPIHDTNTEKK